MKMRRVSKGFTLIELMVVVAVIGIIAAMALPSFKSVLDGRKLVGATDNLYATLQYAKSEAVKRNEDIEFSFNTAAWCYGVDEADTDTCNCNTPSTCTVGGIQKVYNSNDYGEVALASDSFSSTTITFNPRLGTVDDDGNFTLSIGGNSKTVRVNIVGRITTE